jgi:hypothetical protein
MFGVLMAERKAHRATRQASRALGLLVAILLVAGCTGRPQKDQWVLKAFDRHKGYTFEHDGITYHASCFATGRPTLPDGKPDLNSAAMPPDPNLSRGQGACQDILPYLGKPIPSLTQPEPSLLLFVGKDNWRLEFLIEDAK